MFGLIKKNNKGVSRPLDELWQDMDNLFGNIFDSDGFSAVRTPPMRIKDGDDSYLVDAELPGVTDKDIDLTIENGVVTIDVNREDNKDNNYRSFRFHRSFVLPEDADAENIEATLKNGLLSLELKKKPEARAKSLKITVK